MAKIAFKNPKGGTIHLAKVGFDWGAFWAFVALGGLPFFLRRMYMLGFFCLGSELIAVISMTHSKNEQINLEDFFEEIFGDPSAYFIVFLIYLMSLLVAIGIPIYLGIRGGRMTARHCLEEGYSIETKDKALIARAKRKWKLDQ